MLHSSERNNFHTLYILSIMFLQIYSLWSPISMGTYKWEAASFLCDWKLYIKSLPICPDGNTKTFLHHETNCQDGVESEVTPGFHCGERGWSEKSKYWDVLRMQESLLRFKLSLPASWEECKASLLPCLWSFPLSSYPLFSLPVPFNITKNPRRESLKY